MSDPAPKRLAILGGPPVRSRPWPTWPEYGDAERRALARVLESRSWGGHPSPNTEAAALCREFAAYTGATHAVACANGTVSLTLALQAARVAPGAEVVAPVLTFVATAAAAAAAACAPVLVDVLPDTYCMDPDQVEAAISSRTEAVIAVHLACCMADMDRITEICERRGLLLVEDCAHAHGARWRDHGAGSIGDLGSFSMQSSKLLTAGEGGLVTARDGTHAQRLHSLVNCGRKEPGYDAFPERMLGHNLRMTEWQAAVGRAQLARLPDQHRRREARLEQFEKELAAIDGLRPLVRDERLTRRAAYQFVLRYDRDAFAGVSRDRALAALRAEGVPCAGTFYVPLSEDPLYAQDPFTNPAARAGHAPPERAFPVAHRAAFEQAIWLPHELFLGDEDDVADLVAAFAKLAADAPRLAQARGGP